MVVIACAFLVLPTLRPITAQLLTHWSLILEPVVKAAMGTVPPGISGHALRPCGHIIAWYNNFWYFLLGVTALVAGSLSADSPDGDLLLRARRLSRDPLPLCGASVQWQ